MSETATWFLDQSQPAPVDLHGQRVTAILVARNGAAWLPDSLTSLDRLTLRPGRLIAVDNASDDASGELLEAARRAGVVDLVLRGTPEASFGQAVAQARADIDDDNDWIWLLHDDASPDPDALAQLLTFALRTPNLGLAYPLLVRPTRRRHTPLTLELGASVAGTGRRHLGVEPGEAAQGQYEPGPTLGGSTCGLLVSQEAFDSLHGFSSTIPSYRDGIDLGWRANLAGFGVMTCPKAQFIHHQAGLSERRSATIAREAGRSEIAWDRLMGMRLVASHAVGLRAITTWLKLVLSCLVRGLGCLLDKAPDQAKDEVLALIDFVRSGAVVRRLRRRVSRLPVSRDRREQIERLRPPWWSAWAAALHNGADVLRGTLGLDRREDLMLDDLLGDEFESRVNDRPQHVPRWVWGVVLIGLAVVSGRSLLTSGTVRAAHLLGAPSTLADAFQAALANPAGTDRPPAPWLLLEAIGSIPFWEPNWFVAGLLILAVPATTLVAAWYLRRRLGQHRRMSWILALLYALLPVLLGGLNRGDLWMTVLALALPFFVAWLSRWAEQPDGVRAWQPAAGMAVALALVLPIMPALWLPAALALVVTVVRAGDGWWAWLRAALAAGLPLVLWGDWLLSLTDTPGRWLTTPSPLLGATTTTPAWQLLLGRLQSGGLPPLWVSATVFGAIWLAGIVAIIRAPRLAARGVAALVVLTIGVALSRFTVAVDTSRSMPDAGPWLLLGFAIWLSVIVSYLDEGSQLIRRDFGWAQALIGALSILLTGATAVALAWWAWAGTSEVSRGDDTVVPYFVAQGEVSFGANSLIIDQSGDSARWTIRSDGQPHWAQGESRTGVLASPQAWQQAQQIVAQISAGRYDEAMTLLLAELGVRYVVLIAPQADSTGALEASTGLGRGSTSDNGATMVYQLRSEPTAIQLVVGADTVQSVLPGSSQICLSERADCRLAEIGPGALLVLSQPDDPGLVVTVGGVALERATSPDWRAAFDLEGAGLCDTAAPGEAEAADCGLIAVQHQIGHLGWRLFQLVLGFIMVLFALPSVHARSGSRSPRRAEED
ncbi:MAG: glycosyltransferase family 2 protein [Propionibacteriaceae bacterium]|nr:glycosyltransferase family 2 protein [Propionibacteriaceae bacterium]